MEDNNEIFEGKTFQDLTKDIYENSQKKKLQIDLLIQEVHGMITNINDVVMVAPIIKEFMDSHEEHIDEYGLGNDKRLTGEHETQHIDVFSSGDSDRGASIRIPPVTAQTYKGYLEDRRPAANMDPYRAVAIISNSVSKAELVHMIPYDSVR